MNKCTAALARGLTQRLTFLQNGFTVPSLYTRIAVAPKGLGKTTAIKTAFDDAKATFPAVQCVYISCLEDLSASTTLLDAIHARRCPRDPDRPLLLMLDEFEELYRQPFGHRAVATIHSLVHDSGRYALPPRTVLAGCSNASLLPLLLNGGRPYPYSATPPLNGFYDHWDEFRPALPFHGVGVGYLPSWCVGGTPSSIEDNPQLLLLWAKLRAAFIVSKTKTLSHARVARLCGGECDEVGIALLRDRGYVVADVSCGPYWMTLHAPKAALDV